jgi:type II secretion system protein J
MNPAQFPFRPPCRSAFTLLELIIAIAISAIVLISINTLFFGAMHLRDQASEAADLLLPSDRAISIMKKDLLAIVPVGVLAGPMGTDATGIGTTTSPLLEVYTASGVVTADVPWGDVQKIDYSLQTPATHNGGSGKELIRGVTRNLLASSPVAPEPQTLLENVQNLQFSYYDGTNWNDTWSTTLSNIPVAIKVSIDFVNGRNLKFNPSLQFLVPIVSWANTNSVTNLLSN